jgi:hypothetical protein
VMYSRWLGIVLLGMLSSAADIEDDAYGLYSAILRGSSSCASFEKSEVGAIRVNSAGPSEWILKELNPSTPEERAMVENFRQLNSTSHEWARRFDFGRTYRLLSYIEAQAAGRCMYRAEFDQPECAPYLGMVWVRSFSIPSFNRAHTRALVSIHNGREGWGGGSELAEYRKGGDRWQRQTDTFAPGHCIKY